MRSATYLLLVALGGVGAWMAPALRTPRDVVKAYCRMDGEGQQLTNEGWQAMASLMLDPPRTRRDASTFSVVKDSFVGPAKMKGANQAEVIVEFAVLGTLDRASLRFTPVPSNGEPAPVRWELTLKRTSTGWKIDDVMPTPQITVATAIRYVRQTRDATSDQGIKQQGERTLATLRGSLLR